MHRYTLVPSPFFKKENASEILSEAVRLEPHDKVYYKELPDFQAVLVYAAQSSGDTPLIASMLEGVKQIKDFNKVLVSYDGKTLDIVLVAGDKLLLANSYPAPDHLTGEYFIFAALKQFQINPEVTAVYFHDTVPFEMQNDLFRYCKGAEKL